MHLAEALPTFEESVTLENRMKDGVTIDVHVEHEETREVLVSETVELDPDETITLNDDVTFPYGTYHATVDGDDLAEDGTWEITWELDQRFEAGYAYPLELDDHGIFEDPVDRDSSHGPCTWNDEGEVSTGD